MRIYQIVTALGYGDAVGNNIMVLKELIKELGYTTKIIVETVDDRINDKDVFNIKNLSDIKKEDVIIYHLATGSPLNFEIANFKCKKILLYQNVTPPYYFERFNKQAMKNCQDGLAAVEFLKDKFDYCITPSTFNKRDLLEIGYKCKIDVTPICIRFEDYRAKPSFPILSKYKDEVTNVIFVGRIAPNKKIENIIKVFYYYKKYYDKKARLFLVGSFNGMEKYYSNLKRYVEKLDIQDVYFTGHIPFNEILAYYQLADIFLCMSEHEGFCVPLVEAMYFKIPIVALNSTAIEETLGGSGVLIEGQDYVEIAGIMDATIKRSDIREKIIKDQDVRLEYYSYNNSKERFKKIIMNFIGDRNE